MCDLLSERCLLDVSFLRNEELTIESTCQSKSSKKTERVATRRILYFSKKVGIVFFRVIEGQGNLNLVLLS
jgi:hypothetical protein